jgi:hypothetical protein
MESTQGTNQNMNDVKPSSIEDQKMKSNNPNQEKANMTTYSFVRNTENSQQMNASSSPPAFQENSQQNFTQIHPQMVQMPQGQYNQMIPGMSPNFINTTPVYPPGMYGGGMQSLLSSASPTDPRITFQDIPYTHDNSANNTPLSQVDPSPTAETLIPGILRDEMDNKTYTFPGKTNDEESSNGKFSRLLNSCHVGELMGSLSHSSHR